MTANKQPVAFSGAKPTGVITLGNYIGALRQWVKLQDTCDCVYSIVDLHALTVRNDPDELRFKTRQLAAIFIAAGVDPTRSLIYIQSHVPAHSQLSWALGCYTYMGELQRMTQFKEKSQKAPDNINSGLFTYPVLMAADILLYQAAIVPVGDDQKQHIEITRDIAIRFNNLYGETFVIPEPYIPPAGARIMDLLTPENKMSKSSEDDSGYIAFIDPPDKIKRKLKRAVTDSEARVAASPEKPGVTNLMTILSAITGQTMAQIEDTYSGKGYGAFKSDVADAVASLLEPMQKTYNSLMDDPAGLDLILSSSAQKAAERAYPTLKSVYEKIGLVLP